MFQHLDDPESALREIIRVTRPRERVMALDPDHGPAGLGLDELAHRRLYRAIEMQMDRLRVAKLSFFPLSGVDHGHQ